MIIMIQQEYSKLIILHEFKGIVHSQIKIHIASTLLEAICICVVLGEFV